MRRGRRKRVTPILLFSPALEQQQPPAPHRSDPGPAAFPKGEVLVPVMADLGTDHRCHKLALSLRRLGYRPVLLCDRPLHPLGPAWQGIEVRILTPASHYRGFLSAYLRFLLRLVPILSATRSRLWIVEDLPPLFLAALIGKLRGARVVYDAREIILETPMIKDRPLRRFLWGLWHAGGLALVDTLFAVGPTAQAYYRKLYPKKRVLLLPNVPFGAPHTAPDAAAAAAKPAGIAAPEPDDARTPPGPAGTRLVFQGALRWGTGLKELLPALARAPRASLALYGFGPEDAELRAQAASLGLSDRVRFEGVVPFESLHGLLRGFHVGVHLMRPANDGYDLTLANKIFDYLHAETPVLLGPTTANKDLVARHRIGVVVASYAAEDILEALETLERDWEVLRSACRAAKAAWRWEAFEPNLRFALEGTPGEIPAPESPPGYPPAEA